MSKSETTSIIKRGAAFEAMEAAFSTHDNGLMIRYPDYEPCAVLAWDEVAELAVWLNQMLKERSDV